MHHHFKSSWKRHRKRIAASQSFGGAFFHLNDLDLKFEGLLDESEIEFMEMPPIAANDYLVCGDNPTVCGHGLGYCRADKPSCKND